MAVAARPTPHLCQAQLVHLDLRPAGRWWRTGCLRSMAVLSGKVISGRVQLPQSSQGNPAYLRPMAEEGCSSTLTCTWLAATCVGSQQSGWSDDSRRKCWSSSLARARWGGAAASLASSGGYSTEERGGGAAAQFLNAKPDSSVDIR